MLTVAAHAVDLVRDDGIAPGSARDDVARAGGALDQIVAIAAEDPVVSAWIGLDPIVAITAQHGVDATTAEQHIRPWATVEPVVSEVAANEILALQAVEAVVAPEAVEEILERCT